MWKRRRRRRERECKHNNTFFELVSNYKLADGNPKASTEGLIGCLNKNLFRPHHIIFNDQIIHPPTKKKRWFFFSARKQIKNINSTISVDSFNLEKLIEMFQPGTLGSWLIFLNTFQYLIFHRLFGKDQIFEQIEFHIVKIHLNFPKIPLN